MVICRPLCTLSVVRCVSSVIRLSVLLVATDLEHPLSPPYVLTTLCDEPMTVLSFRPLNTFVMLVVALFRVLQFGMRKNARGTCLCNVPFLLGRAVLIIVFMWEQLRSLTALVF